MKQTVVIFVENTTQQYNAIVISCRSQMVFNLPNRSMMLGPLRSKTPPEWVLAQPGRVLPFP